MQIEHGLEIAELAEAEIAKGETLMDSPLLVPLDKRVADGLCLQPQAFDQEGVVGDGGRHKYPVARLIVCAKDVQGWQVRHDLK